MAKRNGRVEYAVLSFGGLFGMGERYHPLPWDVLTYDTDKDGYVIDIDKKQLEGDPSYESATNPPMIAPMANNAIFITIENTDRFEAIRCGVAASDGHRGCEESHAERIHSQL